MNSFTTHALALLAIVTLGTGWSSVGQPALVVDVDPSIPGPQTTVTVTVGSFVTAAVYLLHDGVTPFDAYAFALEYNDTAGILGAAAPMAFDPTGAGIAAASVFPSDLGTGMGPLAPGATLAAFVFAPAATGPGGPFTATDAGTGVFEATAPPGFFGGAPPPPGTAILLGTEIFTAAAAGVTDIAPIGIFAPPPGPASPGLPPIGAVAGPATWPAVAEFYDIVTGTTIAAAIVPASGFPAAINPGTVTVVTPAPIELADFSVTYNDGVASLRWTSASEVNASGYEIEVRHPGSSGFAKVDFVPAKGAEDVEATYVHSIPFAVPGEYGFRLRLVDFDGTFAYSSELSMLIETPGTHHVSAPYPNPFVGEVFFSVAVSQTQHVTVDLHDILGRRLTTVHEGTLPADVPSYVRVDGDGLAAGAYVVRVRGEAFSKSFVVTRAR